MKKVKFIIFGLLFIVKSIWPIVKKFYEDMVVALAVVRAELEERCADDFNVKARIAGSKSKVKREIAKKVLSKSIFSPLKRKADQTLDSIVESGWDMLFNKKGRK